MEEWRPFPLNEKYLVSREGEIYTTISNKILSTKSTSKGYPHVTIYSGSKKDRKTYPVHRIVAMTWVHNPDPINKVEVNHIDGDKTNNAADNLEWVTSSENSQHAMDTGLQDLSKRNFVGGSKKVIVIRDNGDTQTFKNAKIAAGELGIGYANLTLVLTGKRTPNRIKKLRANVYYLEDYNNGKFKEEGAI
jgi:hypothetical protein